LSALWIDKSASAMRIEWAFLVSRQEGVPKDATLHAHLRHQHPSHLPNHAARSLQRQARSRENLALLS
jgi:hypothetical protein